MEKYKRLINYREINIGDIYLFPQWGFFVYETPNHNNGRYLDTNPMTKSLNNDYFLTKEKEGGFIRGNFYKKPLSQDFYLTELSISKRDLVDKTLFCLFVLPFIYLGDKLKTLWKKENV